MAATSKRVEINEKLKKLYTEREHLARRIGMLGAQATFYRDVTKTMGSLAVHYPSCDVEETQASYFCALARDLVAPHMELVANLTGVVNAIYELEKELLEQ